VAEVSEASWRTNSARPCPQAPCRRAPRSPRRGHSQQTLGCPVDWWSRPTTSSWPRVICQRGREVARSSVGRHVRRSGARRQGETRPMTCFLEPQIWRVSHELLGLVQPPTCFGPPPMTRSDTPTQPVRGPCGHRSPRTCAGSAASRQIQTKSSSAQACVKVWPSSSTRFGWIARPQ